jgi:replicative DNA helicase
MVWHEEAGSILTDLLVPSDFVTTRSQSLFVAIATAISSGKASDPVSLGTALRLEGTPDIIALFDILLAYDIQSVEFEIGVEELAEAFKAWSYAERFRQIIAGAQLAIELGKPVARIEKRIEERLVALQASVKDDRVFDDRKKQTDEVVDYYADTAAAQSGLKWGIEKIDLEILPLRPGNFFVIAGRQKAGKSTVARNFIGHFATQAPGVLFSLEMSALEQWVNLACMMSGVPVTTYYRRTMTLEQQRVFGEALGHLRKGGLTINDRAHLTPEAFFRAAVRYIAAGARWLALDHMHRFDYGETRPDELRIPMGNFARGLKNFAMTHQIPVIALSQLTKGSPHDEPDESSYRETSKIGEECDGSFFVYRPFVACDPQPDGTLRPITTSNGGRLFAHEKPRSAVMGVDEDNVYLKPANFRIAPSTALFRVPFNKDTGRLYDERRY